MYQITMAYAYWKSEKHNEQAVFDLFFRKNPFGGEFTVFAGLEEILLFLEDFQYTADDLRYLKQLMPGTVEPQFFEYLSNLTAHEVTVHAMPEGTVVFPSVPLLRVEGPLAVCQLLETTLLTLINFARSSFCPFISIRSNNSILVNQQPDHDERGSLSTRGRRHRNAGVRAETSSGS